MAINNKNLKKHKKLILPLGGVLACALILAVLEATNITNFFHKTVDPENNTTSTAKTTSTAPSAQHDFSDGDPNKKPGNTLNENRGSAIIEETNGANVENTSNPITSDSGEITAYSPGKNSVVKSGAVLSGTSTLPKVEYRIIDSISGVIATGSLAVKDGKFSGKISFDTNATEGRIDLFATKPDFTEYSYIEIPIKFKN